jgi:hypothetical protein
VDPVLISLLSGASGVTLASWVVRKALVGEVTTIVTNAIEKERAQLAERFATREQAARIEGKIDALLARHTEAR